MKLIWILVISLLQNVLAYEYEVDQPGWHMLGTTEAIDNMDGFKQPCVSSVWRYSSDDNKWKSYIPGDSANNFKQIKKAKGFWLKSTGACQIDTTATGDTANTESMIKFTPDSGIRMEYNDKAEVPEAGYYDSTYYLYFVSGPDNYVATSTDGLSFGTPTAHGVGVYAHAPQVVKMPEQEDGQDIWRAYLWKPDSGSFEIKESKDGETFLSPMDNAIAYTPITTDDVGVYTSFATAEGKVGLIYIADMEADTAHLELAVSEDNGKTFTLVNDTLIKDEGLSSEGMNYRDPTVTLLDDGMLQMLTMIPYMSGGGIPGQDRYGKIHSLISTDNGLSWEDQGVVLEPTDFTEFEVWGFYDPVMVLLPDGGKRLYVCGKITELDEEASNETARTVILSATLEK